MTELVEDLTIRVRIHHCRGDSEVMGGSENLRKSAAMIVSLKVEEWLVRRAFEALYATGPIEVRFENTGLHEVPELVGGDN